MRQLHRWLTKRLNCRAEAFYGVRHIFDHWSKFLDVRCHIPRGALNYQDLIVLQKPQADAAESREYQDYSGRQCPVTSAHPLQMALDAQRRLHSGAIERITQELQRVHASRFSRGVLPARRSNNLVVTAVSTGAPAAVANCPVVTPHFTFMRLFLALCSTSARPSTSMTGGTKLAKRPRRPFFKPYQP